MIVLYCTLFLESHDELHYVGEADNEIDLVTMFNKHIEDFDSSHAPHIIAKNKETAEWIRGKNIDYEALEYLESQKTHT